MLLEAAGFALLASLSPTALLVAAVYLGSDRPRLIASVYLAGAVTMSLVMGAVLLLVLRSADLNRPEQHTPRYALRLGLGVLLLVAGVVLAKRRPANGNAKPQQGLLQRMIDRPAPVTAFIVGLLVFAPGATFLAALQVIATAQAGVELTVLAVIIVVVINVLLVWLPIVLYIAVPDWTSHHLMAFNGWLRANSKRVLIWVLVIVGGILIGNGIYGLIAVT
jgi:hypothetical protein